MTRKIHQKITQGVCEGLKYLVGAGIPATEAAKVLKIGASTACAIKRGEYTLEGYNRVLEEWRKEKTTPRQTEPVDLEDISSHKLLVAIYNELISLRKRLVESGK